MNNIKLFKTNPRWVSTEWWGFYTDEELTKQSATQSVETPILCTLPRKLKEELVERGVNIDTETFRVEVEPAINKDNKPFFRITSITEKSEERNELSIPITAPSKMEVSYRMGIALEVIIGGRRRERIITSLNGLNAFIEERIVEIVKRPDIPNKVELIEQLEIFQETLEAKLKPYEE